MTKAWAWILVVLLVLAWGAIPDEPIAARQTEPTIPRCFEDAVLIGAGSFEDGSWTEYTCGPTVDDYEGS